MTLTFSLLYSILCVYLKSTAIQLGEIINITIAVNIQIVIHVCSIYGFILAYGVLDEKNKDLT